MITYHWRRQSRGNSMKDYLSKPSPELLRVLQKTKYERQSEGGSKKGKRASTPADPCLKVHTIKVNGAERSEAFTPPACPGGTRRNCGYTLRLQERSYRTLKLLLLKIKSYFTLLVVFPLIYSADYSNAAQWTTTTQETWGCAFLGSVWGHIKYSL